MNERGDIYAAPEGQVPTEDKDRLSRWQREILERIEAGDEVLVQAPRQVGRRAMLRAIEAERIAQRHTDF